jgi:hypothetical protein
MTLPGTRVRVIVDGVEDPSERYEDDFRQRAIELGPDDVSNTLPAFVCHLWQILNASALPGAHAVFKVQDDGCDVVGNMILDAQGGLEWQPTASKTSSPDQPAISDN